MKVVIVAFIIIRLIISIIETFKIAEREKIERMLCQMRIRKVEEENEKLKAELDRRKRFNLDSKIVKPLNNEGWEIL